MDRESEKDEKLNAINEVFGLISDLTPEQQATYDKATNRHDCKWKSLAKRMGKELTGIYWESASTINSTDARPCRRDTIEKLLEELEEEE